MKAVRLLTLLALLIGLTAGTAQADVSTHVDPSRDVYWYPADANAPVPPTTAPARALGDITKIRVVHAATEVRVVLTMRELTKAGQLHQFYFGIRTGRLARQASFTAEPGHWAGSKVLFRDGSGNLLQCTGLKRTLDYAANTARVVIPRSCLGTPASVRVLSSVETSQYNKAYTDYAYIKGAPSNTPVYGPRVYR